MTRIIRLTFILLIILTMSACFPEGFRDQANQQFGDQHFKTAISLIELHKLR